MTLSKQYKKLIRNMAQSRFPGEEVDITARAEHQYKEFWKTTPDAWPVFTFLKEGRDGEREIIGDISRFYAEKDVSA